MKIWHPVSVPLEVLYKNLGPNDFNNNNTDNVGNWSRIGGRKSYQIDGKNHIEKIASIQFAGQFQVNLLDDSKFARN